MWAVLLLIAGLLAGCDARVVERNAMAIRERNVQNDRESGTLSARKVHEQWFVRDGHWYGKFDDGSLVCLDSPTISATAIKQGRPYCCKWLGEITVAAGHWCTKPASDTSLPYCLTYTVLVRDSSRIEFVQISGPAVRPPLPGEVAGLEAPR